LWSLGFRFGLGRMVHGSSSKGVDVGLLGGMKGLARHAHW
jgi:hypothetical protein